MADSSLLAICGTAAAVGFVHTLAGPDHYIPFVAMAKIGRWSVARAALTTLGCGLAHVASSVVLGFAGIWLGLTLERLTGWEALRGDWAGWLLVGFGFAYFVWGLRRAFRNRPHSHWHAHVGGVVHDHAHAHRNDHAHVHPAKSDAADRVRSLTPWMLFTIFVLGPCEPLIPLVMAAYSAYLAEGALAVSIAFSLATVVPMLAIVLLAHAGLKRVSIKPFERYSHALAGFALLACGLAVKFGL